MKHTIYRIIAGIMVTLTLAALSSCQTNNGDIGDLYATWNLTKVTIDGEKDPTYHGNVTWSFQSNIVWMIAVLDHEETATCYASWELGDGDKAMALSLTYGRLEQLESLPWGSVVTMTVETYTSDTLTLRYINNSGQTLVYYFKKLV